MINDAVYAIIAGDELTSLKDAMTSADWPDWKKAVKAELDLLTEMGTWTLVPLPRDVKPIANKWVFIKKRNKKGDVIRHRARLVAKGCAQRPGYDYMETYSPVIRMDTLRAILALVPAYNLKIQQMDVKGAYLNGILQETIYMRQPEGCEDGTGRVCRMIKTLYGLKQAGREWNKQLDQKLKSCGYKPLRSDACAYVRREKSEIAILTIWVDDTLLFASSDIMMDHMKTSLRSKWQVTDLGEPTKIVGIEITVTNDSVKISQRKYIESVLRKEGMLDANAVGMPMEPKIKLVPNPKDNAPNRSNSYAQLIGELHYISNSTRPDIAYAVNKLASYTANPSLEHYTAVKRILRYLAGTTDYGITYKAHTTTTNNNFFYGYSDAAYANSEDSKSTSGYVFLAAGGAITWRSKKQTTVALSSTESEYVALSEAGREATWLRTLYNELGFSQDLPILIKGDNEGSITLTRDPQHHNRTKHIDIRHHYVRELVEKKIIDIHSCRDPEQTADILTKPLPKPKHNRHRTEMGVNVVQTGSFPRM
jgi:hypothetical protein